MIRVYLLLDKQITVRTAGEIVLAFSGAAVMSVSDLLTDSVFAGTARYRNALAVVGDVMAACYVLAVVGFEPMFRYRHRKTKEVLEG